MMWPFCASLMAQNAPVNLVPNGSFELHDDCPNSPGALDDCDYWWPLHGTPDYFHSCSVNEFSIPSNVYGYQNSIATSDSAYVGVATYTTFFNGGQESLYVPLSEVLQGGVKYRVSFKVSMMDSLNYSTCCVGAVISYISPQPPPYTNNISDVELVLDPNLTDPHLWYELDQVYTAVGGENMIYIGSFRSDAETNPVYRGEIRPNANFAGFYIDDVSVIEDDLVTTTAEETTLRLNMNTVVADGTFEVSTDRSVELFLFDVSGRKIYETILSTGHNMMDVSILPNGLYVAVFSANEKPLTTRKVMICR